MGAGLLKSEEILEGVARLRISDDIEFEEETFLAMMNEAREVCYSHLLIFNFSIYSIFILEMSELDLVAYLEMK